MPKIVPARRRLIDQAPMDGTEIIAFWGDGTGQEYAAIAWFRSWKEVKHIPPWTKEDEGWWTYVSSMTQEKIEPTHFQRILPKE